VPGPQCIQGSGGEVYAVRKHNRLPASVASPLLAASSPLDGARAGDARRRQRRPEEGDGDEMGYGPGDRNADI
jgi:hypothetical protein